MPATAEPQTTTAPAPVPDTGIAQGAPSTGAAPSSFRPTNPALEAVKNRMFERFKQKAQPKKVELVQEKPEPPKSNEPKPPSEPDGRDTESDVDTRGEDATAQKPSETKTEPSESADKGQKKLSPWRVIDDYKKTTAELKAKVEGYEKEIATLKSSKPAEVPKEIQERLIAAEAKVKEYEDEIRFTNYQRHPEFIEKYQKPYMAAFAKATAELSEVAVTDPNTGEVRQATAEDMQMLLSLPLGKAREVADQMFGAFANDAMAHRRDIKAAFDAQRVALEEAKKNGSEREKQWREQQETEQKQTREVIENTWSAARREATTDQKHGKFFTPVEGDQKGNAALAKGLEFADKAFKLNPMEPGISNEERADRVKRHVAMHYRAAAYPRMRQWLEDRDARIAELEKQLDEYSQSEPGQAGGTSKPAPAAPKPGENFYSSFAEKLRKKAR